MPTMNHRWPMTLLTLLGLCTMTANSDEGMWLLNDPPRDLLKARYQFELTDEWLTHAQLASIRFNNGGSGSFVSPDGLIITNHHIASDALQKLSTAKMDLLRDGFYARTRPEELKCPDLELNVLISIEDVTERVNAAVKPGMTAAEAAAARRAVMSELEKASLDQTGLRSDVVTLYQGGLYHLYRYKKYTDVRLVFAPEQAIASFGGDVDNFEFPRFNLDITFFRAYENGQPAKVEHWLKWSKQGPTPGDVVFVTGHPGTTNRLETLAKLLHRRDRTLPYTLARLRALEAALIQFGEKSPEFARIAATDLHRVANARKAFSGQYQGLLDSTIIASKTQAETELRQFVAADPTRREQFGTAWDTIAAAQTRLAAIEVEYALLERGDAFSSELFGIARHLVRLADELPKPNAKRLREYRDSNLDSLKLALFSPAPIEPELEKVKLGTALTFLAEQLGGGHPLVQRILAGQPPHRRAAELVAGCTLADPATRRKLFEGGQPAIAASTDPLILLARAIDEPARQLRERYESEVEEPERQGYAQIAAARFAKFGRTVAPDATFTLRLAFGVVKGYEEDGRAVPHATDFAGLFARARQQLLRGPFQLPQRWLDGEKRLDLNTPFNFVSTADTIGGNSGSPVLNRAGEFVGINFDRNRHGLVRNFVYTEAQARHICVHSRGILEALTKLYDVVPLLREIGGLANGK
jgi:hypothetical protein